MVQGELKRNGVLLQTRLAEDLPRIQGGRIQLQQVILNLLINASEAMSAVSEGLRELWVSSEKVPGMSAKSDQDRTETSEGYADAGTFCAEAERTYVLERMNALPSG